MRAIRPAVRNAVCEAMIFGVSDEPAFWRDAPVAQIEGSLDNRFPGAATGMDALASMLPGDRIELITGAGHRVPIEPPEAFRNALIRLHERFESAPSAAGSSGRTSHWPGAECP